MAREGFLGAYEDDRDDAQADDFRCYGCECVLRVGYRGHYCPACREERGMLRGEGDE